MRRRAGRASSAGALRDCAAPLRSAGNAAANQSVQLITQIGIIIVIVIIITITIAVITNARRACMRADEIDAVGTKRYDSQSSGEREIQRTMLELLNQLDGFDAVGDVKVRAGWVRWPPQHAGPHPATRAQHE